MIYFIVAVVAAFLTHKLIKYLVKKHREKK